MPTVLTRPLIKCLFALLSLFTNYSALAASESTLHKYSGFEFGYGTFHFDQKLDHTVVYPVASLMLGVTDNRLNYVFNISGSTTDGDASEEDYTGKTSREDIDLTVAYQINKQWSAFTGYKVGKTELNVTFYTANSALADGYEFYKQSGPYLGVNYNLGLEEAGKFSFSLAYADLDSDNKFVKDPDSPDPGNDFEFDDINGTASGSSTGYSLTLGWSKPLKGNLIFRTRLRVNKYTQTIHFQNYTFNHIDESNTMLLIGMMVIF